MSHELKLLKSDTLEMVQAERWSVIELDTARNEAWASSLTFLMLMGQ